MALNPQQLQALFQAISSGNQSAYAQATPGMSQDERNQWINQYSNGGTGYGDYMNWYQQNQGNLNRQGPMYQPGGIFYNQNQPQATNAYTTPPAGSTPTTTGAGNLSAYNTTPQPQPMPQNTGGAGAGMHPPSNNTGAAVTSNATPSYQNMGRNTQGSMNPYLTGGMASDPRIFNPTQGNAFAPPTTSVGGATYNPGGAAPVTPGGTTTTPAPNPGAGSGGGSGGGPRPVQKGYQINPMYYKGWNTGGGGFGR